MLAFIPQLQDFSQGREMDRMQSSSKSPVNAVRISESLDKRLLAYTLVAGAGLAAAPETVDASVVYTNPSDVNISVSGQFIDLDLNNDGTADARVSLLPLAGFYG